MDAIFRDLDWKFIVGVAIGLLSIVVPIYIFFAQRIRKSLAYIITETNLLQVSREIKGGVKILFEDIPLESVHFIEVQVINNGNGPIRNTDFEDPLIFDFGANSIILSPEIIETEPKSLKPEIERSLGQITLKPLLLNSRDMISIKLLIAGYQGKVMTKGRIAGVSNMTMLKTAPTFTQARVANWLLGAAILIGLIAGYSLAFPGISISKIIPEPCIINSKDELTLSIENFGKLGAGNFRIEWDVNGEKVQDSQSIFYIHRTQKATGKDIIEAIIFDEGVEKTHLFQVCTINPPPAFTP